jgi:hypothetical protein
VNKGLKGKLHTYHISVGEALEKMPKAAVKSIVKELVNMWGNANNMHPVSLRNNITTKEKHNKVGHVSQGKVLPIEKLKSKLVALGNMQDVSLR